MAQAAVAASGLLRALREVEDGAHLRRIHSVGPRAGDELASAGLLAVVDALGGILLYVALRLEYRYTAGAIAARAPDLILTRGVLSPFQVSFDLGVLSARRWQ